MAAVIARHILGTARAMHSVTDKATPCVHNVVMMCISACACAESLRESPRLHCTVLVAQTLACGPSMQRCEGVSGKVSVFSSQRH